MPALIMPAIVGDVANELMVPLANNAASLVVVT